MITLQNVLYLRTVLLLLSTVNTGFVIHYWVQADNFVPDYGTPDEWWVVWVRNLDIVILCAAYFGVVFGTPPASLKYRTRAQLMANAGLVLFFFEMFMAISTLIDGRAPLMICRLYEARKGGWCIAYSRVWPYVAAYAILVMVEAWWTYKLEKQQASEMAPIEDEETVDLSLYQQQPDLENQNQPIK
ncbi:hypothetical protein BGZ96_010806 [Linnemannia gamsii]|uniref:Uncharacterized protein n=1 Tax=Linnemannia gamsii TaxID=64522 RepID=A0ABQ7JUE4_9FUNG|nr:hypothetical protein BGZ96_010806 [Linnemannia gamsii]